MFLLTANIFQPLIDIFEAVLKGIHGVIGGSWGWSIVLLTVLIRALLIPLTLKQFHSMQKLQRLQPADEGASEQVQGRQAAPAAGVHEVLQGEPGQPAGLLSPTRRAAAGLHLALLHAALDPADRYLSAEPARGTAHRRNGRRSAMRTRSRAGPTTARRFLFIPDLTNKATGAVLIVLIVLYVGTQLGSSLLMSSPTMDKTQRQIMLVMPLFFVIFIINFPAGVIVYWITTNTWTIGQQYIVRRRLGPIAPPVVAATGASDGAPSAKPERARPPRNRPRRRRTAPRPTMAAAGAAESGGGLGGLLRGRTKDKEPAAVAADSGPRGAPPPPPKKKKKRSGRRR